MLNPTPHENAWAGEGPDQAKGASDIGQGDYTKLPESDIAQAGGWEQDFQAEAFLTALDETAESWCFQTFDDNPDRKDRALARTLHGTLEAMWNELERLNLAGAGIFVTVNEVPDRKPRTADNIIRVRACFADFDPPKTSGPPAVWPIEPTIQVESSPGRLHAYWTVDGLSLDSFKPMQQTIAAKFGSDPAVTDLPRVMRLPSFRHMKDPSNPHWVRLVATDPRMPYKPEDLASAFPPAGPKTGTAPRHEATPTEFPTEAQIADLRAALLVLDPDDRPLWVNVGLDLYPSGEVGYSLWDEFSARSKKYDPDDQARRWAGFSDSHSSFRAVFSKAYALGWRPTARPDAPGMGEDYHGFDTEDLRRKAEEAPAWTTEPGACGGACDETGEPPDHGTRPLRQTAEVTLTRADTIAPQAVSWLWPGWLARGKLHILAGAPGTGKTTAALAMAATVTIGGRWPDGTWATPGDVVIWSGEDDPADTLVPRLLAAGADLRRVHIVAGVTDARGRRPFDPSTDMAALAVAVAEHNPDLLIVDSIASAIAGDSHKNSETRRGLQPLVDLGAACRCAVLGITHLTKGTQGRDPTERVTGSLAFGALARVVLVAAKIRQEEGGGRLFARAKSNLGPDGGGFGYDVEVVDLPGHPGLSATRILWGDALTGTAHDLLGRAEAADADPEERTALDDARGFLLAVLADGPVTAKAIQAEARDAGHAWATVRRAQSALGIEARKDGIKGPWKWYPPEDAHAPPEDAQHVGMSAFGNLSAFEDAHPPEDAHAQKDTMSAFGEPLRCNDFHEGAHVSAFKDAHPQGVGQYYERLRGPDEQGSVPEDDTGEDRV